MNTFHTDNTKNTVDIAHSNGDCLSALDGRYCDKIDDLKHFFSEIAYVSYRKSVEQKYFYFLCTFLPELHNLKSYGIGQFNIKWNLFHKNIDHNEFTKFEKLESTLCHDVKSIEYMVKMDLEKTLKSGGISIESIKKYSEFVHFGLTSEDINSTAMMLMLKDSTNYILFEHIPELINNIEKLLYKCNIPSLAFTHGQPATPVIFSSVFETYLYRLSKLLQINDKLFSCKFGGASGNMASHKVSYPEICWEKKMEEFVKSLNLNREEFTTQISNYDDMCSILNQFKQMCVILKDMCVDMWLYISKNYFIQSKLKDAVGSSTMPHKTNPINFENAEGNFKLSIHMFEFFARELPVSRLHRDLSGSTIIRNLGAPFGYMLIGIKFLIKGLNTIEPNYEIIEFDLNNHWEVITEAYQTILRKEGYEKPYETLKTLSNKKLTKSILHSFVDELDISNNIKNYMKSITPQSYSGIIIDQK